VAQDARARDGGQEAGDPGVSSKRHLRRKQCSSKRRFGSQEEAHREVMRLVHSARFARKGGAFVRTYRCKHCAFWHFGHSSQAFVH